MKHYGEYLLWAGRPTRLKSEDIAMKIAEKKRLQDQIDALDKEIVAMEMEFLDFISDEWKQEEIREAQQKAQQKAYGYNYNFLNFWKTSLISISQMKRAKSLS